MRDTVTLFTLFSIPRRIRNEKRACIAKAGPRVDSKCGDAMVLPPPPRAEDPPRTSSTRTEKEDAAKDKADD